MHALDAGVEMFFDQRLGQSGAGDDFAPAPREKGHGGRLLVAGKIGLEKPIARANRAGLLDGATQRIGGKSRHVLPGRIAGRVAARQVNVIAFDMRCQLDQFAIAAGRLGRFAQYVRRRHHPMSEETGLGERRQRKARRADDGFAGKRRRDSARMVHDRGAAAVRSDERGFRRRQRNVVVALRVDSVDPKRTDDAQGNFDRADEVLDVAAIGGEIGEAAGIGNPAAILVGGGGCILENPPSTADGQLARRPHHPHRRLACPLRLDRKPFARLLRR